MDWIKKCSKRKAYRMSSVFDPVEEIPVANKFVLRELEEGVCCMITGVMPQVSETFSIHFNCNNPKRDIALRISVRLPQNFIYRNSRVNLKWGKPECASECPFNLKRGSRFYIHVLVTEKVYLLALNGVHFTKYAHRTNYANVSNINVFGNVRHVYINLFFVDRYPGLVQTIWKQPNPIGILESTHELVPKYSFRKIDYQSFIPLPHYVAMPPNALSSSIHLRVEGRVRLLPLSFSINLQRGSDVWPHPLIAFCLKCRFGIHDGFIRKNVITRNAWINGEWGSEEVSKLKNIFLPGKTFTLIIIQATGSYQVFVDKQFVTEFRFRIDPSLVDTVYLAGDMKLWRIGLEEHRTRDFRASRPRRSVARLLYKITSLHAQPANKH